MNQGLGLRLDVYNITSQEVIMEGILSSQILKEMNVADKDPHDRARRPNRMPGKGYRLIIGIDGEIITYKVPEKKEFIPEVILSGSKYLPKELETRNPIEYKISH